MTYDIGRQFRQGESTFAYGGLERSSMMSVAQVRRRP